MPTTRDVLVQHDKFLDAAVDAFERQLGPIVSKAQKKAVRALERQLSFAPDGTIEVTPSNQRALRSIDRLFARSMKTSGYDTLVAAYADQFADHLPKFQDVLNQISDTLDTPLAPIKFTGADLDLFASQAIGAKEQLLDVVGAVGSAAKRQALFSVGGLKFSDLSDELGKQFDKTVSQAKTIADTSTSVFFRTIANQAYKKIEQDLPKGSVRYTYAGPDDSLTRPWCDRMLAKTRANAMTREEIEKEDPGTGLPPFLAGGGFNCRHSFVISLTDF
jgi:hypothetical protein